MKARLATLLLALPACAIASPFGVLTGAAIPQVLEQQRQEAARTAQAPQATAARTDARQADAKLVKRTHPAPTTPVSASPATPDTHARQADVQHPAAQPAAEVLMASD
ncbi:hypothetical protein NX773_05905 [Massilia solisilvae]|uniref:DUF4148 domain-containing protein n=1 Tax=Massilia solisilvae TaxID=1811225 RepID=A0ABT2BGP6_9BURK|nr:hypothetical protein [Massilia solisilvae]MCS0607692.1 hypothetical protein [Massilia solisilvae]